MITLYITYKLFPKTMLGLITYNVYIIPNVSVKNVFSHSGGTPRGGPVMPLLIPAGPPEDALCCLS